MPKSAGICRLGHVSVLTLVPGTLRIAKCDSQRTPVVAPRIVLSDDFRVGAGLPLDRIRGFSVLDTPLDEPGPATVNLPGKYGACALLTMFGGKVTLVREQRGFLADI
jgi:hypothetical protein